MAGLDWLTARPIAHRGLHDPQAGIVENTASAAKAAIAAGYGIEVDLQISADGEAMVHHDDALGRLTEGSGRLDDFAAADLKQVPFKATADRMMTLGELLDIVAGRVTLVLELKGDFGADQRLVQRTAAVLAGYNGPVAAMSFDPRQVVALRRAAPGLPRGIVAERHYDDPEWGPMSTWERAKMAHLLHAASTQPHFVAYSVQDLPAAAPLVARYVFGVPLLTWTVRTESDLTRARRWASQIIFEGIRP